MLALCLLAGCEESPNPSPSQTSRPVAGTLSNDCITVARWGSESDTSIVFTLAESRTQSDGACLRSYVILVHSPDILGADMVSKGLIACSGRGMIGCAKGAYQFTVEPREGLLWGDVQDEADLVFEGLDLAF